ncbi:MAG: hypothetical protein DRP71_07720 [Verrucomicrobia bacterium]|nr:MAG: hypothetical protein DRP71_07720 [Verrucomicrobiota bacterium]
MRQFLLRIFHRIDRILLGLMLVIFLWMAVLSYQRFGQIDSVIAGDPIQPLVLADYTPEPATPLSIVTQIWEKAPAQSSGKEWIYDVFTPPVIYYNPVTLQFTVSPPEFDRPVILTDDPFDLELLEVRPQPFRIQLVGYVGQDDDYLATFENVATGETMMGRPGRRFEGVGITLRSFELRQETIPSGSRSPVFDTVAVAVVFDEETGQDRILTDNTKAMLPGPEAVFRIADNPIIEYLLKEGAEIRDGTQVYSIEALILSPSQATVRLTDPALPEPIQRTILPSPRYIDSKRNLRTTGRR